MVEVGTVFETSEFQKRQEELDNLRDLTEDWDSYDGQPPFTDAILKSETLLHLTTLYDIVPERIVASREGGVSTLFQDAGTK